MEEVKETKEFAKEWIEAGKPCRYRYGLGYRGAVSKPITKEKALELLPKYDFGAGFYELSFCRNRVVDNKLSSQNCVATNVEGEMALEFNELSANDMW